jgi:transcription initiation factor IIF auxiliary subunit
VTDEKVVEIKSGLKLNNWLTAATAAMVLSSGIALGTFKANDTQQNVEIARIRSAQATADDKRDHMIAQLDTLNVMLREQVIWSRQQVLRRDATITDINRRIEKTEHEIEAEKQRIDAINNRWRYTP